MRPGLGLRNGGAGRGASRCMVRCPFPGPLAAPAPCCAHRVAAAPPVARGAADMMHPNSRTDVTKAAVLDGLRVIDFGQYMAGPLAAMLLGDHGADVVRVDPPGGPRWNTPANATWNRNKRSIVLDLKQDGGRDTARQLIAGADVVIENFRPCVMDRLGVGAAAMTEANPRLIYCSL